MNQIRKCFLDMTAQYKGLELTPPDLGRLGPKKGQKIRAMGKHLNLYRK